MTTYLAAARFRVNATAREQWHELSDLSRVAQELVRLAFELGKTRDDVEHVFEMAADEAIGEWDEYEAERRMRDA